MTPRTKQPLDPMSSGVLAWLVPGAGHWALGRRAKAAMFFVLIIGTFLAGWIRSDCANVWFERGRLHTLAQLGGGLITFALGLGRASADPKEAVMHLFEIGTLYTMVAGLLNVLVVMDAVTTSMRLRRTSR